MNGQKERTGDVKMHSESGGSERMTFGLKTPARVDDIFAAVLLLWRKPSARSGLVAEHKAHRIVSTLN